MIVTPNTLNQQHQQGEVLHAMTSPRSYTSSWQYRHAQACHDRYATAIREESTTPARQKQNRCPAPEYDRA